MGRAIVREPAIFLFDEPLSNLDAKLRVQMRLEIKQLQSRLGVTSLYVTHDQVEAMTMADRMIVMNEGIAEQIGTPLEVYERPQSLFAAQFIGSPSMNILDGRVEGNRLVIANGAELTVGDIPQGPVKLGIRPEHIVVDDAGFLDVTTGFTEPLGATTLLHGKIAGSDEAITVSLPGVYQSSNQQAVTKLGFSAENIHLFDPESGRRYG